MGTESIKVKAPGQKSMGRLLLDWAAVIALALSFAVFSLFAPSFLNSINMINILRAMSITTVFGIAATVTMSTDGFDMSSCTLATVSAYTFMSMYLWYGMSLWMSILVTVIVTLILYQLTMFLILVCKVPDMLATCALQFVHQGIGLWYVGGGAVSTGMLPNRLKESLGAPARTLLGDDFKAIGANPAIIIGVMLASVLLAYIFLEHTKFGRYMYAIGGNKQAAKLSGINVKGYRYLAGMITAIFIVVGAVLVVCRQSAASVSCCDNYFMLSLAAVFVGRSVGGAEKPNAIGTLVGALLVAVLENGLNIMGVNFYFLPAVKGIVMLLALVAAYATKREN